MYYAIKITKGETKECQVADTEWNSSLQQFLTLSTNDILNQTVCCGGHPVYYRIFSSIPGFYPLDTSSNSPSSSCDQEYLLRSKTVPGWEHCK